MKLKFFLIIPLLSIHLFSFSQNYREVLTCERQAFNNLKSQRQFCTSIKGIETFSCQSEAWETYSRSTCTNSGKYSGANMAFILRRIHENFTDHFVKQIIFEDEFKRKANLLNEIYGEGIKRWGDSQDVELDAMEAGYLYRKNLNFFSNLIELLGGRTTSDSKPNSATYIINNRVITCAFSSGVTICN
jgi:hypothetical protein